MTLAPRFLRPRSQHAWWWCVCALVSVASQPSRGQVVWSSCDSAFARTRCGSLTVPEDRSRPDGRRVQLRLFVTAATTQAKAHDPILVLLGGPGDAASRRLSGLIAQLTSLNAGRDLVFVDQRGTGRSSPLECAQAARQEAQAFVDFLPVRSVAGCAAALRRSRDLARYGTRDFVEDLEAVRAALGVVQWNLHAVSYGTRVALDYVSRHAASVRSAVLIGVVPPELVMPVPFGRDADRALRKLAADCAADSLCAATWPRFLHEVDSIAARLERAPAPVWVRHPVTGTRSQINFTRAAFGESVRAALYTPAAARSLPRDIRRAFTGDLTPLAEAHLRRQRGVESWTWMYLAVTCAEDLPRTNIMEAVRLSVGTVLGDGRARQHVASCQQWPRAPVELGWPKDPIDTPVLMIVGDQDPVTPPQWAEIASRRMRNGRLVVVPRGGHGFAGLLGVGCLDRLQAEFIASPRPAALNATCVAELRRPPFATDP